MALTLKKYQTDALAALEGFFSRVRGATALPQVEAAFDAARREALGEAAPRVGYRPISREVPSIPQVCLRIPTGGGKTLLAAHAIERAARLYVGVRAPLVLWLVPTSVIQSQTLEALKTAGHPYREALLEYYPADRLAVIDIADCEQLRAQDFGGRTIVAVGTIQTLRVGRTASRDVYAYKEAFEPHFSAIPEKPWMERVSEADVAEQPYLTPGAIGKVKRSFANLLAYHRPIVIMDEAHNAQTSLTYEVFERIRPACVIEWTATPAADQNVLYHVSAQELKAENMIKLPIVLAPHPNWQEAVRDSVLARERLAKEAAGESEYIRPIVLFQADAKDGEVPVDRLKTFLLEDLKIDARRIAVATGAQRELDGINLFDRACPIEFVITVDALKEGWDCSFAYVFCTVQNIRSAKDMEQLLGRVLRLPYAQRCKAEHLNRAYAHVCSPNTATVAGELTDRLISMGFEEMEAAQAVQVPGPGLFDEKPGPPPPPVTAITLPAAAAKALAEAAPGVVAVVAGKEGSVATVTGLLTQAAIDAAVAAAPKKDRGGVEHELNKHQARAHAAVAPSTRGDAFAPVPQLCVFVQEEMALLDADLLNDLASFSLAGASADLPGFEKKEAERQYLIDVERGHVGIRQDEAQYGLDLDAGTEGIRLEGVIRELDRRVRRGDILQPDMIAWLGRVIEGLSVRGIELTYIARHANQLVDAIGVKLKAMEQDQRGRVFQGALFGPRSRPGLSAHHQFRFDPARYPARWYYGGRFQFRKHFYPLPGELDDDIRAEETACAIEIENLPGLKFWVRNLERQPVTSFWLPTSTDRFYPDFVAQLDDGRIYVVEYKGGDRYSNDDSREKRAIGEVWAGASKGRCKFKMVTDAATGGKSVAAQLADGLNS